MDKQVLNEFKTDFYKRTQYMDGTADYLLKTVNGDYKVFKKEQYDWYIVVAIEKANKVKEDRNKLNYSLIVQYRNAIREGYNHMLDRNLVNEFDHPRNRNTITGIQSYIDKIFSNN